MKTIFQLLTEATARLGSVSESPRLDAEVLLSLATGKARTHFLAWPEKTLTGQEENSFLDMLEKRLVGHPLAHITGTREFWSREFIVTPDVLIPRPETELLIELALKLIPANQVVNIADLGTGSGAIAVTLGLELPQAHITALDLSPSALKIAEANAARLGAKNIGFVQSDWFSALPSNQFSCRSPDEVSLEQNQQARDIAACYPQELLTPIESFDLIVSNPPYIAENDPHLTQGDVRFEPRLALTSGSDGLDAIRHIIRDASIHLNLGGWLLFEHGYDQADRARELLKVAGFVDVESFPDLQGHFRVSGGRIK